MLRFRPLRRVFVAVLVAVFAIALIAPGCATDEPSRLLEPVVLEPFAGVVVVPEEQVVRLRGWVCIEAGWLEQIACAPQSREHESLIVIESEPSQVHAALLSAGFTRGAPGGWSFEHEELQFHPPTGAAVAVSVEYARNDGTLAEDPIRAWIRDAAGEKAFPDAPWVFGGSRIETNVPAMGAGQHYLADMTGSIIGLVTFGDEVLGFSRVLADQAAVQEPEWVVNTDRIPPVEQEVFVIIRPYREAKSTD